jgi:hypothetical protein
MSEQDGKPVRQLRAARAAAGPEQVRETAESVLPGLPRVGALDALLREVDSLRLSLETDLTLAAAAVEGGAPQIAVDIIDSERAGLRAFESRALDHLSDLAHPAQDEPVTRRWWTRIPAAPFVAAAAVVGFLVGVVPHTGIATPGQLSASPASASQSLATLTRLAADGQTSQVRDAAATLHSQLMVLIGQAGSDPNAARQGLLLLASERAVITQSGDSQALRDVLAASTSLSNQILNALPANVRTFAPTPPPVVVVVAAPSPSPSTTSSPKPTTKPTTKPTSKPTTKPTTAPPASSSPTPSPSSSSSAPVLPSSPHLGG